MVPDFISASEQSLVFLYVVRSPLWMFVTHLQLHPEFDVRKKIISALDRVIPCQEFCVPDF